MAVGVLWYQIIVSPDSDVSFVYLETVAVQKSKSIQEGKEKKSLSGQEMITDFLLDISSDDSNDFNEAELEEELYRKLVQSIGNDLHLRIKTMPAFNIVGRIDSFNNNEYQLFVRADSHEYGGNYFWIMENVEDQGQVRAQSKGLLFLQYSPSKRLPHVFKGTQIYGSNDHLASWVTEAPRRGFQFQVNIGQKKGFNLKASDSNVVTDGLFTNDVTSGMSMGASLASAPVYGKYQVKLDGSIMFPDLNLSNDFTGFSYLMDAYLSVQRNYWAKKWSIQPYVGFGLHMFRLDFLNDDYLSIQTFAAKAGMSVEKMSLPFVTVGGAMYSTLTFGEPELSYYYNDEEVSGLDASSRFNWVGYHVYLKWIR